MSRGAFGGRFDRYYRKTFGEAAAKYLYDAEVIAHRTGIHFERVQEMMTYMVDLGLFENQGGVISCLSILKRLDKSMSSNKRFRSFLTKAKENHDDIMTIADEVMQEEEVEEEVEEEIKHKRPRKRAPQDYQPSASVLDHLAKETGLNHQALLSHLPEMKDHEFKSPRKDWDAVFRNWVRRSTKWEKSTPAKKLSYAEQLQVEMREKGMI